MGYDTYDTVPSVQDRGGLGQWRSGEGDGYVQSERL